MSPSKRGIAVPWNFKPEDFALYQSAVDSGKIAWLSNWEMWKPQGLPTNLTYVPQVRTSKEVDSVPSRLQGYKQDSMIQHFMGFNEPDVASQANLSVSEAVKYWKQTVLPATTTDSANEKDTCKRYKVGSPSVSNGPDGISWLDSFFRELGGEFSTSGKHPKWSSLGGSGVDYIVIHWYGTDVGAFKHYVRKVHQRYANKPVWVTEFSCTSWDPANPPSEKTVLEFMTEALKFLDGSPFVERYAWFGAMEDVGESVGRANGFQKDGKLTEAGKLYCSL